MSRFFKGLDVRVTDPESPAHPKRGRFGKVVAVTRTAPRDPDAARPIVWVEFADFADGLRIVSRLPFFPSELMVVAA